MGVVVDTSVWSLLLRRGAQVRANDRHLFELRRLVAVDEAVLIGPVRQEILTGISGHSQFVSLRARLRGFNDVPLPAFDFERAAEFANLCARSGIQGSTIDFLICAVAERLAAPILTIDKDFERYAELLPIALLTPA